MPPDEHSVALTVHADVPSSAELVEAIAEVSVSVGYFVDEPRGRSTATAF